MYSLSIRPIMNISFCSTINLIPCLVPVYPLPSSPKPKLLESSPKNVIPTPFLFLTHKSTTTSANQNTKTSSNSNSNTSRRMSKSVKYLSTRQSFQTLYITSLMNATNKLILGYYMVMNNIKFSGFL